MVQARATLIDLGRARKHTDRHSSFLKFCCRPVLARVLLWGHVGSTTLFPRRGAGGTRDASWGILQQRSGLPARSDTGQCIRGRSAGANGAVERVVAAGRAGEGELRLASIGGLLLLLKPGAREYSRTVEERKSRACAGRIGGQSGKESAGYIEGEQLRRSRRVVIESVTGRSMRRKIPRDEERACLRGCTRGGIIGRIQDVYVSRGLAGQATIFSRQAQCSKSTCGEASRVHLLVAKYTAFAIFVLPALQHYRTPERIVAT